jgi:type I restriction-modification system DNA methylase subunit
MTGAQLTTDVERLRVEAANRPRDEKEQLGQFLTPPDVAELVASLFQPLPIAARVRLLDPGAGIAEQETN